MTNKNTREIKNIFSFFIFQLSLLIGLSTGLFATLTHNADIVSDSLTELQWQDNETPARMNWESAIDYCEALSLGGHTDWRLPNKKELLSIVDYSSYEPSINTVFVHTISSNYWSSTTSASYPNYAWLVDFKVGLTPGAPKSHSGHVRCVR